MSASINRVTLLGHVGGDPEIRSLADGRRVAGFSVATSESWVDKVTGEKREKTQWTRISVLGDGLVGVVQKYVHKGSRVLVEGQLQTRKYTDQAGVERFATEVVLSGPASRLLLLDRAAAAGDGGQAAAGGVGGLADEIPF